MPAKINKETINISNSLEVLDQKIKELETSLTSLKEDQNDLKSKLFKKYTNSNATGAMGAKEDNNPLHHDKYLNSEAITAVNNDNKYIKKDGTEILTSDWDIGNGQKITGDEIRARGTNGLKLRNDGGWGIMIKDSNYMSIGGYTPTATLELRNYGGTLFHAFASNIERTKLLDTGCQVWDVKSATDECGSIEYATPSGEPGIVFRAPDATGRSQFKQFASTGGLAFGSTTTSSCPSDQMVLTTHGRLGINTSSPTAKLDINSETLRLRTAKTPASSGAAGNQGDICRDANFIYICTATNTWKRVAIAAW